MITALCFPVSIWLIYPGRPALFAFAVVAVPLIFFAHRSNIGRLLRATAMDELPQLWNILRGDMSFVGPRALRPGEIEVQAGGRLVRLEEVPGFEHRLAVRPGLTGLAQIYAPRDVPRRQKFRYDRVYVEKRSWMLDMRLILLSFWISFLGTWEARGRKY